MLLPRPLRLPATALLVVCVAVTVTLAIVFAGHTQPSRLDAAVDPVLRHSLGRVVVLLNVCYTAGLLLPVSLMTLALTAACLVTRRWSGAVLALLAAPVAAALADYVLKPLVDRTIRDDLTFPSGHATATFALAVTCAVLLLDPPGHRVPAPARLLLASLALLAATTVALGMVARNSHYLTDAVGGAALGTAVVLAGALTLDRAGARRPAPRSNAKADPGA